MGTLTQRPTLVVLAALALIAACTEAAGPDSWQARLIITPSFAPLGATIEAENPAHMVDNVRVILVNLQGNTVVDRIVDWPLGQDTLRFEVVVEVSGTSSFDLEIQGRTGSEVVFQAGPIRVDLVPGSSEPPQLSPVLEYTGPEASLVSVELLGAPDLYLAGDTFVLSAIGALAGGGELTDPLMRWTSLDPAAATVDEDGRVRVLHDASRTVRIEGRVAFTDIADTVTGAVHPVDLAVKPGDRAILAGEAVTLGTIAYGIDGGEVTGAAIMWEARRPDVIDLSTTEGPETVATGTGTGESWVVATTAALSDSLLLTVHPAGEFSVLILSNHVGGNELIRDSLQAHMPGLHFEHMDVYGETPSQAFLSAFRVVLLFEDGTYTNAINVGNAVADYVLSGGNVVIGTFYWQGRSDGGYGMAGYGALEDLDPFISAGGSEYNSDHLDRESVVDHPLTAGVDSLWVSSYHGGVEAKEGTTVLARWSDGVPLIGFLVHDLGQRFVGVSTSPNHQYWAGVEGDFWRVWTNAIDWAGGGSVPNPVGLDPASAPAAVEGDPPVTGQGGSAAGPPRRR